MNKLIVNLGFGRSGTTFLYNVCRYNLPGVEVWHEKISGRQARRAALFRMQSDELIEKARESEHVRAFIAQAGDVLLSRPLVVLGGTTSHLAPLLLEKFSADQIQFIHVHRHPFLVAAAALTSSGPKAVQNIPTDNADEGRVKLTPFDERVHFKSLQPAWKQLNPYCRILYQWLEHTFYADEFAQLYPHAKVCSFRSSELFKKPKTFTDFVAEFLEQKSPPNPEVPMNQNSTWIRSREKQPLREEDWIQALAFPEFTDFPCRLGYDCSPEFLKIQLAKYGLPPHFGSWIRNKTGYWKARAHIAQRLRGMKLLESKPASHEGAQPRSSTDAALEFSTCLLRRFLGKSK